MKKLKVYGGNTFLKKKPNLNGGTQTRTIIAAPNKKRAVELLGFCHGGRCSMYEFSEYWCETGNKTELAIATREGVWVNQGDYGDMEYVEAEYK